MAPVRGCSDVGVRAARCTGRTWLLYFVAGCNGKKASAFRINVVAAAAANQSPFVICMIFCFKTTEEGRKQNGEVRKHEFTRLLGAEDGDVHEFQQDLLKKEQAKANRNRSEKVFLSMTRKFPPH